LKRMLKCTPGLPGSLTKFCSLWNKMNLRRTDINSSYKERIVNNVDNWVMVKGLLGIEVLTAMIMKSSIFWYITSCGSLKVNRHFGVTHSLHLHGRISRATYQRESTAFLEKPQLVNKFTAFNRTSFIIVFITPYHQPR
jgi:hypothetical protein